MAVANQSICIALTLPQYVDHALDGLGRACATSCKRAGTPFAPKARHHVTLQVLNGLTNSQVQRIKAAVAKINFIPFTAKLCKKVDRFGQNAEFAVCPVKSIALGAKPKAGGKKSPRSYNFLHQEIDKIVTPILGHGIGAGPQYIPHCALGKIQNPAAGIVLPTNKASNVTWTVTPANIRVL